MNNSIEKKFSRAIQSMLDEEYDSAHADLQWLHDHPDDDSVEYLAIRRNFVLSAWAELGRLYEPAFRSLEKLLEEKFSRLAAGDQNPLLEGDINAIKRVIARQLNK